MADPAWNEQSPLGRFAPGRHGAVAGEPGVILREIRGAALTLVQARRGMAGALAKVCWEQLRAVAPTGPGVAAGEDSLLLWSGADQFLLVTARPVSSDAITALAATASVGDQSHGRSMVELSGPRVRDLLAKLVSIDLHDRAFPEGAAAATSFDHTGVNIWREPDRDGEPVYRMLILSTFADSLFEAMLEAGAEYGVDLPAPAAFA